MNGFLTNETICIVATEWVRWVGGETLDCQKGLGVEK